MKKKFLSLSLVLCMVMSMMAVGVVTTNAAEASANSSTYGLVDDVQKGQILQCWNWSFTSMKNNMKKIAEQGFSAVQTSPIQQTKESTKEWYSTMKNSWWVYYQPIDWKIETSSQNALGTASEFKAMCAEAHKYGVKVIVDAVLNHTGNNNGNNSVSTLVPSDIRDDSNCWHDISRNSWYESRWDITQFCMEGLPDLNTWNSKVQDKSIQFLKECIDAGADGFRFDGAKHIETPVDNGFSSEFWPNVLNATTSYAKSKRGITPYYYGEVLDSTTGSGDSSVGQKIVDSYTSYMSITLSDVSNTIRNAVNGSNAGTASRGDFYLKDGSSSKGTKSVLWNESHDTYADGESSGVSDVAMKKTWALVGSRNEACGMYMARPKSLSDALGTGSVTAWGDAEVRAVNKFKNDYAGKSEYLSNSGSIAYNERSTTGAVLVNVSGTNASVNVDAKKLSAGTYTDDITGNTFTVANGKITGSIGSTGIAVIRKGSGSSTTTPTTPQSSAKANIYFDNSTYKWSSVYAYVYTDGGEQNAAWPGKKMSLDSTSGYYKLALTGNLAEGRVIFTESSSATTNRYPADGATGLSIGGKDKMLVANNSWKAYVAPTTSTAKADIYFDNSSYNWSSVYAYVYTDGGEQNAAWPGKKMSLNSATGYYKLSLSGDLANGRVIFTESASATTNRYPADGAAGLLIGGKDKMLVANKSWKAFVAPSATETATIKLNKTTATINIGSTTTATATVSDTSLKPTWSTSNSSVATVKADTTGKNATITAVGAGTATITAKLSNGKYATIKVTAKDNSTIKLNKTSATVGVGTTTALTATITGGTLVPKWSTSDSSVATVKVDSTGKSATVTAVSVGTATITATLSNGKSKTVKFTVKDNSTIKLSRSSATIYTDGSLSVTATITGGSLLPSWSSSNTSVAKVKADSTSKAATITPVGVGTATITATLSNGKKATLKITVKDNSTIKLSQTSATIYTGSTLKVTSTVTKGVLVPTWSSSDTSVATVKADSTGSNATITAVKLGTATITAALSNGKKATIKVTVKDNSVVKLNRSSATVYFGNTLDVTATVTGGNLVPTWTTSNASVATVKADSTGKVAKITPVGTGSATITAKLANGKKASIRITAKDGTSIRLSKTSATLYVPGEALAVTATLTNGTQLPTWASSDTSVAKVTVDSTKKNATITPVGIGTASITATLANGKKATVKITVKDGTKITIPTSVTIGVGESYTLVPTITGTASSVAWSSADTAYATVSASGKNGVIKGVAEGKSVITATLPNGEKDTITVTVKAAPTKITLSPKTVNIAVGESYELSTGLATGTASYTRKFTSANTAVATVKQTTATKAEVTGVKAGTTTITVKTYNGLSATITVNVTA